MGSFARWYRRMHYSGSWLDCLSDGRHTWDYLEKPQNLVRIEHVSTDANASTLSMVPPRPCPVAGYKCIFWPTFFLCDCSTCNSNKMAYWKHILTLWICFYFAGASVVELGVVQAGHRCCLEEAWESHRLPPEYVSGEGSTSPYWEDLVAWAESQFSGGIESKPSLEHLTPFDRSMLLCSSKAHASKL